MRILPLAFTLLLVPAAAAGQSLVEAPPRSSLSLEMLHPSLDDDDDVSFVSGAYFLGGRLELRPGLALVAELPFGYLRADADITDAESSSTVGNPLIGIAFLRGQSEFVIGGRVPLAADDEFASLYAMMADQYRLEAFLPDAASLQASARLRHMASDVVRLGFDIGSVLLIPTGDAEGDAEVMLDYGGSAAYVAEVVRAGVGLNGRGMVTADGGDLGERTEHQATLFADFGSGRIRPGVSLRVPLDDDTRGELSMTLGFSLQYLLP